MPGYSPPSARMRQIKKAQAKQVEVQAREAEKSVDVTVGAMKATVSAGPDGQLGTADDVVKITPVAKPVAKPVAPKPVALPKVVAKPVTKPVAPPKIVASKPVTKPVTKPVAKPKAPSKPVAPKPVAKPKPKAKLKSKTKLVPKFDKSMTKEQLLRVVKRMNVKDLTMRDNKTVILKALKNAVKSWK